MALPSLYKTWRFCPNVQFTTAGSQQSDCQNVMYWIYQLLALPGTISWKDINGAVATAPPAWTVPRSSNSVTAANSDLWAAGGVPAVVHADGSQAHSWVVLKNTAIGSNFQLCLDYCGAGGGASNYNKMYVGTEGTNPATVGYGGLYASQLGGYTGGTNTDRPFVVGEVQLFNRRLGATFTKWVGSTTPQNMVVHAMRSTDGLCNRIIYYMGGVCIGYLFLDVPQYPATGSYIWNNQNIPWVGGWVTSQDYTTPATSALLTGTASTVAWIYVQNSMSIVGAAAISSIYFTTPAFAQDTPTLGSSTVTNNLLNPFSGKYSMAPVGLTTVSGGNTGFIGMLPDIWAVPPTLADGDCFPASGTRQFAVFGDFAFPWCGVAPLTS